MQPAAGNLERFQFRKESRSLSQDHCMLSILHSPMRSFPHDTPFVQLLRPSCILTALMSFSKTILLPCGIFVILLVSCQIEKKENFFLIHWTKKNSSYVLMISPFSL